MTSIRLTAVLTHPVQYYGPWFRYITTHAPELDLTVLYATAPTPAQQGVGFGQPFQWDVPLREGYRSRVVREPRPSDRVDSDSFLGLDVPEIGAAIEETHPDVMMVPGWHSVTLVRALRTARRLNVPVLFRGDTNLNNEPVGWRRPLWHRRTRRLLALFDAYLCPGQRVRAYLQVMGVAPWQIVDTPHCVDNARFAAAAQPYWQTDSRAALRRQWNLPVDAFVLLFVGKLEEKKRPLDVIRSAARLGDNCTVLMVGAGPLEAECRAEASRLNVRVTFLGFLNQSDLGQAYGTADVLVLPSDTRETWGLVVNEALASGLPVVVSDQVGCAPDLVDETTGAVYVCGDVTALGNALKVVRERSRSVDYPAGCQLRASRFDFRAATAGLVKACQLTARVPSAAPRVVACCGNMVTMTGLERMAFAVLQALRQRGARVHCIVNSWENHRVIAMADAIGATWSEGGHEGLIRRRNLTVRRVVAMARDISISSAALWRAARRLRATHVLVPDHLAPVRNFFALLLLRATGVRVIMKLANAPDQGRFYRIYWRWLVNTVVDEFICNSDFTKHELCALGVSAAKTSRIYETRPPREAVAVAAIAKVPGRVAYVGQIIPGKGLDLLLDAVARVTARGIPASLVVAGDIDGWTAPEYTPFREALRRRAEAADLAGRVTFLGWRDDIPAILAGASLHSAPSRPELREGFGLVNLEAKEAGLPSVVFASGAFPEVVSHRVDGWVCEEVSADALAEGLEFFLCDPDRLARASIAARRSLERFDPVLFDEGWAGVFSRPVQGRYAVAAVDKPVAGPVRQP